MSVTTINSALLKSMVTNGAINLKNQHKEIDDLNVFPVPDGDTGTNMSMTMMSGVTEMANCKSESIIDIAKSLSRGLLMAARGNSGVILSQFFRGLYMKIKELGKDELTLEDFASCLVHGYEVAYKAVMEPVEGTILTVVREAAEKLATYDSLNDLEDLFEKYIAQARISLDNTPNLLPVLKEAKVVDSGGAGFLKVAEGMQMAVKGQIIDIVDENADANDSANSKFNYKVELSLNLKYPTEFKKDDIFAPLANMGDCVDVSKEDKICNVTACVNQPGAVLNLAIKFGEIISANVASLKYEAPAEEEVVLEHKKYAIIAVCFGEGIKNTFKELGVDYVIDGGQTMNPPTEEFVKAVNAVNADNVLIIPNNSNVVLSAEQAVKLCSKKDIKVLKAKTVAQGYASLMVFDPEANIEENFENMTEAIKHTSSGEVTYAVRDTEIKGVKIASGDYMGICNGEIIVSTPGKMDATKELLNKCITEDSSIVTIFYGNDVQEAEAMSLQEYCEELNEDIEVQVIEGNQDIYSYIISVE